MASCGLVLFYANYIELSNIFYILKNMIYYIKKFIVGDLMFQNYELVIELNKIRHRFKGHPTKIDALITTINEIEDINVKAIICSVLKAY